MRSRNRVTRRGFLALSGGSVAGVLLASCAAPAPTPTPAPAAKPAEPQPAATATPKPAEPKPAEPKPAAPTAAPTKPAEAKPSAAAGEIKFLARGDDAIFKVFRDLRDAFQKEYAKIKVAIDESPGDWYQKFQLQIASGTPPDAVFESAGTCTATARAGGLQALDDYMKSDKRFKKEDYWDIAFLPSQWQGKTYHLPYDGGSMALYYNKEMFAANGIKNLDPKTPITMQELLDISFKLTTDQSGKHPGESGFDPKRMKTYGYNGRTWWAFVFAFAGEVFSEDGKTVRIHEPAAVEGIQWLGDLGTKHFVAPSPEFEQAQTLSFSTGAIGINYGGVWDSVRQRQNKFDWDVAPFPKGKAKVSTGWYSGLSITSGSKLKDAAWEWVFFCCSEPGQKIVSSLGQAVPAVKALANTDAFLDPKTKPEHKQVFLDEMDGKILRLPGDKQGAPFMGYWREFGQVINPMLDPVWRGKKTAADALKEAQPKLNHLLATGQVT